MSKKTVKIVAIIIACLFLLGIAGPLLVSLVYAQPTDATLEGMRREEQAAINTVQELEKQLNEALNQVYQMEKTLQEKEAELAEVNAALAEAEAQEAAQMERFKRRVSRICEQGSFSYLDLLFSAVSFSDFIDRVVIAQEIAEYDNNILDSMEQIKEEIRTQQARLEEIKAAQEAEKAELDTALAELETRTREATTYMKKLQEDTAAYQAYLDAKAQEEAAAKNRAGLAASGTGGDAGRVAPGTLLWPVSAQTITSPFSPSRVNPVSGQPRPHTGTDIGAGQGAPIWAAQSGTVILAEYNGGYGNCVILDHGNGVTTLYGHMSAILVSRGAQVAQGQQIGRVGSTGNSTGPHLHFEVLVDGAAVDPMQYF